MLSSFYPQTSKASGCFSHDLKHGFNYISYLTKIKQTIDELLKIIKAWE